MSKCDLSQRSDQNMDESIFTTTGIYIIVGASYVNLISLFAQLAKANVSRFLTTRHTHKNVMSNVTNLSAIFAGNFTTYNRKTTENERKLPSQTRERLKTILGGSQRKCKLLCVKIFGFSQ